MPRVEQRGKAFSSLYELETTLAEVMRGLRFAPLSNEEESEVRDRIGCSIGLWHQTEGQFQQNEARLDVQDVQSTLRGVSKKLDAIHAVLGAVEEGLQLAHNFEVVGELKSWLAKNPEIGSLDTAQAFLSDFIRRSVAVAEASRVAAAGLQLQIGKRGRHRLEWHDGFTDAVIYVCGLNGVRPNVIVDRITGSPSGKFFEAAQAFERLIPPRMRAPGPGALVKRLLRSKGRLRTSKSSA